MDGLDFNQLPFSSKVRICWGFFWRGFAITIGSSLCGFLLGAVVGFVFGFLGMSKGAITVIGGVCGVVVGLAFVYIYVRWLLGSRIGNYRLALVEA